MSADLLTTFEALGVILTTQGEGLHVKAPAAVLTPDLRALLAGHKAELLAALALRGEKPPSPAPESDTNLGPAAALGPALWEDPRPELAEDTNLWRRLLFAAYVEGHDPDSLFWILQGLRCYGAALRLGKSTAILEHGEIDAAEYAQWRAQYLAPKAGELRPLLAELALGERPARPGP